MSDRPATRPRIHAMLVHFPVSAWAGAALIELMEPFLGGPTLAGIDLPSASIALIWIGVAIASVAAVAGMIEFARLPEDQEISKTATRHMLMMLSAFFCFLLLGLAHPMTGALPMPVVFQKVLAAAGLGIMMVGGHIGGHLVSLIGAKQR